MNNEIGHGLRKQSGFWNWYKKYWNSKKKGPHIHFIPHHNCRAPGSFFVSLYKEVALFGIDGSLKIKVVNNGEKRRCDNFDKHGKQHSDTKYVAGHIASKNRKKFIKGKWTVTLKLSSNGEASMFPTWWLLGAQNNEPPVQEANENICWPLTGSGEIDIYEHHGDGEDNHFTTGAIRSLEDCDKGDWWSLHTSIDATLNDYHDYSVEWEGSNLV